MNIGTQLYAPDGFQSLKRDVIYHFLINDAARQRAVLVSWGLRLGAASLQEPGAHMTKGAPAIIYLARSQFEQAIHDELIVPCDVQRELPHWFGDITIAQLREQDEVRKPGKVTHGERIDRLLTHLWPAVRDFEQILSAENPIARINELARACQPSQNETRYRNAFFTYMAFSRNHWALHYSYAAIGDWDREVKGRKFGRQSIEFGALHGWSACSKGMQRKIEAGYRRFCGPGEHFTTIYQKAMVKEFGCRFITDECGKKRFTHPQGEPFPSFRQFEYWVAKAIGLTERQVIKYGESRTRNRLRVSIGPYAECVGNLMEMVEEDAYQLEEVSQGYEEGSLLPKMWVVRIRCLTSGLITGVGFSIGGERADAYRMAKACQALDKVWFCGLFGVVIQQDDWPSQGLSLHEITDRGPGSTARAQSRLGQHKPIIKEGTPSYAGQSKASIETTNPKNVKIEGAPHYRATRLTIPQLAAQEIRLVLELNHTININARLTNNAVANGVLPTPIHYWNHLDRLGRTHAVRVDRDEVIRGYFSPITVEVDDGALYLYGQRYWSKALSESGLLERWAGAGSRRVQAYMLDVCVRHLFIDTPSGAIVVDAMQGIRNGDEMLYLSVVEIEQLHRLRARGLSTLRTHVHAVKAEQAILYEEEFGIPYKHSIRRRGRAKMKNAASREEASAVMGVFQPGRRAG